MSCVREAHDGVGSDEAAVENCRSWLWTGERGDVSMPEMYDEMDARDEAMETELSLRAAGTGDFLDPILWHSFAGSRKYRAAFAAAHLKSDFLGQILAIMQQRGWTDAELAKQAGLELCDVSNAIDPTTCKDVRLETMIKIASACDVAVIAKFVPFSQLARECARPPSPVPGFSEGTGPQDLPLRPMAEP